MNPVEAVREWRADINWTKVRWWLSRTFLVPVCAINMGYGLADGSNLGLSATVAWAALGIWVVLSAVQQLSTFSWGFYRGVGALRAAVETEGDEHEAGMRVLSLFNREPRPWDASPVQPELKA